LIILFYVESSKKDKNYGRNVKKAYLLAFKLFFNNS